MSATEIIGSTRRNLESFFDGQQMWLGNLVNKDGHFNHEIERS
jgi:hypothetical protein